MTYSEAKDRLRLIGALEDGWAGEGSKAPNATACWTARCLLDAAGTKDALPEAVYPCSDGAVAMRWG
jgi:hypothetical protein